MSVPLKKQKLGSQQAETPQPVVPTKYEADPVTLINFPSSVMNGVTAENGLYSLTFKSISCYKLVDNTDMMRRVLVDQHDTSAEVTSPLTLFSLESMLKSLGESHLAKVETSKNSNDSISSLHKAIESARSQETDIPALENRLRSRLGRKNGDETRKYEPGYPIPVLGVKIPGFEITSIEDVLNMDMSVYETV